jgi:hypothetical protein
MSTIDLDVKIECNKISIKTEIFLIFHIPSFWDLNSLIIPHNTIDVGGSVFFFPPPVLCCSQISDRLEDDLVKSGYR